MTWVTQIGEYHVEKMPVGSGGGLTAKPSFCIHTTEGSTYLGAVGTIKSTGYAPHFTIGDGKIAQMRSLSEAGSALRAHNDRFIQVECVGFSHLAKHQLTPGTWQPLIALSKWLRDELGIPLYRPWPDPLASFPASNNSRRQDGYALTRRGFYGHVDVPDQSPTWHWDPGSLDYTALFDAINQEDEEMSYQDFKDGATLFKNGQPLPGNANADVAFGYNLAKRGEEGGSHRHDVTSAGKGKTVTSSGPKP